MRLSARLASRANRKPMAAKISEKIRVSIRSRLQGDDRSRQATSRSTATGARVFRDLTSRRLLRTFYLRDDGQIERAFRAFGVLADGEADAPLARALLLERLGDLLVLALHLERDRS